MDSDCRRFGRISVNRDPLYICFLESKNGQSFPYVGDQAEFSALTGLMGKEEKIGGSAKLRALRNIVFRTATFWQDNQKREKPL
jgi:hypothetical protein